MKILLLAPHPFYQERGTPIAVDLLLRALSERGDELDLLTFNEGDERSYPNVSITRIRPWPRVSGLRPGFSAKKLLCDLYLFVKLIGMLRKKRYEVIHAVEESAFMAMLTSVFTSIPFIYDMDSSMVTQMLDKFSFLRPIEKPLRYLESLPMRRAVAVIPVCQALADEVAKYRSNNIIILKDVSLIQNSPAADTQADDLRSLCGIPGQMLLYIGNLETYQGIDLLLESFAITSRQNTSAHLVVIGGQDADIDKYRRLAASLGAGERVHFVGKRPVGQISQYMQQADVLVSPRIHGVNTPMKVYSYLHSGIAVLATDMPTHTQVMTNEIAMLAKPTPEDFARAMTELLTNDSLRAKLGSKAQAFIETEHSYPAFKKVLYGLYRELDARVPN